MKKILVLCVALALYATSAFAVGADLTAGACPGNAGSSGDAGSIDCAGGATLQLYATFQPNEAISDLVGVDAIIDLGIGGDVNAGANFWDLANVNAGALNGSHQRPGSGCTGYTNTWNQAGAGFGAAALVRSPSSVRIAALSARPGNLAVTANQKLFGFLLTIDASTSAEGGGTALGCSTPASIVLNQITPGSAGSTVTTPLTAGSSATNCTVVNGGNACASVPAARHTWGQLKSLYR